MQKKFGCLYCFSYTIEISLGEGKQYKWGKLIIGQACVALQVVLILETATDPSASKRWNVKLKYSACTIVFFCCWS